MTRQLYYILDAAGEPIAIDDVLEWSRWFHLADRHVSFTTIKPDEIQVSTVFLGLNHRFVDRGDRPLLWETLVFGGPLDGEMDRYATRDEAVEGHQTIVARVRAAL